MINLNYYGSRVYPTLRDTALEAANNVFGSIPIRMYGNKSWNVLEW